MQVEKYAAFFRERFFLNPEGFIAPKPVRVVIAALANMIDALSKGHIRKHYQDVLLRRKEPKELLTDEEGGTRGKYIDLLTAKVDGLRINLDKGLEADYPGNATANTFKKNIDLYVNRWIAFMDDSRKHHPSHRPRPPSIPQGLRNSTQAQAYSHIVDLLNGFNPPPDTKLDF